MRVILWLCLACATMLGARAEAACSTVTAVSGTFATVTSYDLRAGSVPSIALPSTFTCDGAIITLLGTDYARASTTSTNGFRLRSAAGDSIGYKLAADSSGNIAFTQGSTVMIPRTQLHEFSLDKL